MQHTYTEIVTWYQGLAGNYPNIVKYVGSIGKSIEGRDVPAVHFTNTESTPKYTVYFQCQIHASKQAITITYSEWKFTHTHTHTHTPELC